MGAKQLLFLALGIIIVGSVGYVGARVFVQKRGENLRYDMQTEIITVAQSALQYYHAPRTLGGGGRSFTGFQGITVSRKGRKARSVGGIALLETENGTYTLMTVTSDSVVIEGVGDPIGDDGTTPIKIRAIVGGGRIQLFIVN